MLPYSKAKIWVKRRAIINTFKEIKENIKEDKYSETPYFYPSVKYSYDYNGANYKNDCVTFEKQNIWTTGYNSWGDKLPEDQRPWHNWAPESNIDVYINPKAPHESVLLPTLTKKRKSHYRALIAGGLLVFGFWALLIYDGKVTG